MFRIKGNELPITPGAINAFYGTDSLENFQGSVILTRLLTLTRNRRSCWGDRSLPFIDLSNKFSLLFCIAIKNIFPYFHMGSVSKLMGQVFYAIENKRRMDIGKIF